MSIITEASQNMIYLPRYAKRILAIIVDVCLCILCTWIAFYLRLEQFIKINDISILAVLISIFLAIPIFWLAGLYKTMFRFAGLSIIFTVAVATFAYSLLYFSVIGIYGISGIPRSIGIIQPVLLFLGILSSRIIIKYLFVVNYNFRKLKNKKNILIYGAGNSGRQLLTNLENNFEMRVVGFLDDNKQFHNQTLLGQTVHDPSEVNKIIRKKNVNLVLLALPSINRKKRNKIIEDLNKTQVIVKTLPSIQDIVDGKISVSDIKDLTIEDLLGREEIHSNLELSSKNISSKVVLVSGAGGSIGSEISRQIIKLNPKKLLLLEFNEFALYKINDELKNISHGLKIIPLLINVQNESRLDEIFKIFKVDTVYHAAAYKHVPLVEFNVAEGIINNIFGTYICAIAAINAGVKTFVLISSDKAVRPTNIMGATKRVAELILQGLSEKKNSIKFSMVRFGNVLGSSGSVIPLFKRQIKNGGPVTVTDKNVIRYFMSVSEAVQLVIQAGAIAEGGDVFILDMGKPVLIDDMAKKMIKLSGLSLKDESNPDGDIEIQYTKLRPGEKLFEELLIGKNSLATVNKNIMREKEEFLPWDSIEPILKEFEIAIDSNDVSKIRSLLIEIVPGYKPHSSIKDILFRG